MKLRRRNSPPIEGETENNEIKKNENFVNSILKNVIIENFELTYPNKGNINLSRIIKNEDTSNNYVIENINQYKFIGAENTSLEELTISNQGGNIGFRIINNNLGTYISNDGEELNYDELLQKIEINNDDLKSKISFDIEIILTEGRTFKATVEVDIPADDVVSNGKTSKEITDLDIVFKRVEN